MIKLFEEDLRNGKKLLEEETLKGINKDSLFKAGMYCILAVSERYDKQQKIYQEITNKDLCTPEKIIKNKKQIKEIISTIRWPNQRLERIVNFSEYWSQSMIYERISKDIENGRTQEFSIRNYFADTAPGIAEKSASFFMNKVKYVNVVPLDVHLLRYMNELGFKVEIPNYVDKSGPKKKEYLRLEQEFIKYAKELEITPVLLQASIWSKYSTWKNTRHYDVTSF